MDHMILSDKDRVSIQNALNAYQKAAISTAAYPADQGIAYTALGLSNEAGEYGGAVKKHFRGDYDRDTLKSKAVGELGDVLWYVAACAAELGLDLGMIASANMEKLASRQERGVIKGEGDNR